MVVREEPSRTRHQGKALVDALCDSKAGVSCGSWPGPLRVKTGKAQREQMFSALPLRADIAQCSRHVGFVPGTDIVGPATQASGDLVDQVEPLPTFNGVAESAGLVGTPER